MSNTIAPVTFHNTSYTGVLLSSIVGKGIIKQENWEQTIYPNGAVVTRINYASIEIYDNRAVLNKYNQPTQIDLLA